MANYGAKSSIFAPFQGVEPAAADPTYGAGIIIGKLVSCVVTPNNAEGDLPADNSTAEYLSEITDEDIALETDDLILQNSLILYGAHMRGNDIVFKRGDVAPYGGYAFYHTAMRGGQQVHIQKFFDKGTADAIFLMKGANVRWASGFKGADSYLLTTPERAFLITDPRYTEQAGIECPDIKAVNWREKGGVMKAAAKIIKELNLRRIAFEDDALTYQLYGALSKETDAELIPAAGEIEKLRSVKTAEEIQYLRAACDIACRAFYRILEDIRVGVTEKELAAKLSAYMVFEGADTQPYGNILISGPNTSLLHGIPSDRALGYGDFVLMDYGCQFNGYMSDMTRTVVVGKATDEQKCVYALEKQMIEDSLAVMKAGADTGEVYRASIKAIENTEYRP